MTSNFNLLIRWPVVISSVNGFLVFHNNHNKIKGPVNSQKKSIKSKKKWINRHNATPTLKTVVTSLQPTSAGLTYEDPSELEIEFRLDALWLLSEDLEGITGTTSWDRWMLGGVVVEVRFLLPVSEEWIGYQKSVTFGFDFVWWIPFFGYFFVYKACWVTENM